MPTLNRVTAKSKFCLGALLLTCLSTSLGGCNFSFHLGSETLDAAKVESSIKDGLKSQAGLVPEAVTCPKDMKQEANQTFQCQVTAEKTAPFTVDVTQTDDQGNIHWDVKGLISLAKVEQEIQQGVEKQNAVKVTADCDGKFKVVRTGETFECQVTDSGGKTQTAKVTATNDAGAIDWKL